MFQFCFARHRFSFTSIFQSYREKKWIILPTMCNEWEKKMEEKVEKNIENTSMCNYTYTCLLFLLVCCREFFESLLNLNGFNIISLPFIHPLCSICFFFLTQFQFNGLIVRHLFSHITIIYMTIKLQHFKFSFGNSIARHPFN